MKKLRLIQLMVLGIALLGLMPIVFSQEKVCTVYFTYAYCGNCKVTDPILLTDWTKKYPDLIIIEYYFDSWRNENANLLGLYAQRYGQRASVPRLFINENNIAGGRIQVPNAENDIKSMNNSPCLLLNKSVNFSELNLNELKGKPSIWYNGRVLVKKEQGKANSDLLKKLLLSENLSKTISESSELLQEIKAEPAPLAYGKVEFKNAIKVGNWVLKFNQELDFNTLTPTPTPTQKQALHLIKIGM